MEKYLFEFVKKFENTMFYGIRGMGEWFTVAAKF